MGHIGINVHKGESQICILVGRGERFKALEALPFAGLDALDDLGHPGRPHPARGLKPTSCTNG